VLPSRVATHWSPGKISDPQIAHRISPCLRSRRLSRQPVLVRSEQQRACRDLLAAFFVERHQRVAAGAACTQVSQGLSRPNTLSTRRYPAPMIIGVCRELVGHGHLISEGKQVQI
jgi:hypothetical protein